MRKENSIFAVICWVYNSTIFSNFIGMKKVISAQHLKNLQQKKYLEAFI
jgi:hypothetical protein